MITNLKKLKDGLEPGKKELFERIFSLTSFESKLNPPESMYSWINDNFESVEEVKKQKIVRIDNKITGESSLFNELRSKRPIKKEPSSKIEKSEDCPFCQSLNLTPEDSFGRVEGKYCITASNIAKYDYFHGLIIFNEHNPYSFEREKISDYIDTSLRWFKKANEEDGDAVYPYLMWNCLWRAGASIDHGHMQAILTKKPYPKIKKLRRNTREYEEKFSSNYWEDIFSLSKSLDLGMENDSCKIFASLTPLKNKEVILHSPSINNDLIESLSRLLKNFYKLGVRSFNISFYLPSLDSEREKPVIVKFLDRGGLSEKTSDMGAMELYTSSVIGEDPFKLMDFLESNF